METQAIVKAYATLIRAGRKSLEDVPEHIKADVQKYIDAEE